MKRILWTLAAVLLFAGPALAADTWDCEPGSSCTFAQCDFNTDRVCWWDNLESGGLDVTTVIDTQACENVTVQCFSSISSATHLNTCTVYSNGDGFTISATDLTAEVVKNAILTGDPAASPGLFAIYGFDAAYVYARFDMNDAGTTTRLSVHCHPRVD